MTKRFAAISACANKACSANAPGADNNAHKAIASDAQRRYDGRQSLLIFIVWIICMLLMASKTRTTAPGATAAASPVRAHSPTAAAMTLERAVAESAALGVQASLGAIAESLEGIVATPIGLLRKLALACRRSGFAIV
jgi:uncharacterized protein (DUF2147 family)